MNREERHDKYDKALAALVNAKVAFSCWDKWEEDRELTNAYELIGELFSSSMVQEVGE